MQCSGEKQAGVQLVLGGCIEGCMQQVHDGCIKDAHSRCTMVALKDAGLLH